MLQLDTKWRVGALVLLAAWLLCAGSALAGPAQRAEEHATALGVARGPQQAVEHVAALRGDVAAAVAAGEGPELLASHDPDVLAALPVRASLESSAPSRYSPPVSAARVRTRAHAAGCYGSPSSQWTWWVAGATAGWVYVRQNGWCGSGGVIWNLGGYATFASWSWGPFCLTGKGAAYSWDVWPSWVHMAHWATFGLSYPWGCFGYSGGKAPLRIAWNGYWDRYNDFGF
jgi:hypothetical protein